jgi:hypothetical protein
VFSLAAAGLLFIFFLPAAAAAAPRLPKVDQATTSSVGRDLLKTFFCCDRHARFKPMQ